MAAKAENPDPSQLAADEVARSLGTDVEAGLSAAEAARRLAADGPNALRAAPPTPLWQRVVGQLRDPLVYLLLAATVVSLIAWVAEGRHGWPVDSIVIAAIVAVNAVLGVIQELKAQNAVAALQRMTGVVSTVVRGGKAVRIPSHDVVRGDLL